VDPGFAQKTMRQQEHRATKRFDLNVHRSSSIVPGQMHFRHCEERSDEAIHKTIGAGIGLSGLPRAFQALAMTPDFFPSKTRTRAGYRA